MTNIKKSFNHKPCDKDLVNTLYYMLKKIRNVEERIAEEYPNKQIRCPTHLSIGQEGVPASLSTLIDDNDFFVSTHRGHAHYLAKGGDGYRVFPEGRFISDDKPFQDALYEQFKKVEIIEVPT